MSTVCHNIDPFAPRTQCPGVRVGALRGPRAYFVDYGEASGLTLPPQGVDGPILRTASSPYRRGSDQRRAIR